MDGKSDRLNAGQLRGEAIRAGNIAPWNAELVLLAPGRDIGVRHGVDIGVYTQGHPGNLPAPSGQLAQQPKLGRGFDIDLMNIGIKCRRELRCCLPDAGKDDAVRRDAGRQRPLQLAPRHDVGAGAEASEEPQYRLIGIRLDRVTDQRVER